MKKVLVVASVISMIEWFNKENLQFLKQNLGCDVHLATHFEYLEDTNPQRTRAYIETLKSQGIKLHHIPFARSPFAWSNIKLYKQLKKLIDQEQFDLIHCHTPTASVLTRLAARKSRQRGTHVMYTCHGFHFHASAPVKNWLTYYPVEWVLSWFTDTLVTICREDYGRLAHFHMKNKRYIPGVGVDITHIQQVAIDKAKKKKSIGVPADGVLVLSVGELIPRKNHQVIIRALGKLKNPNIYYAICGKGPLAEELRLLANQCGLAERFLWLGFRQDIPELLHAADISAFPSRIEGLGLAGIEALAAGTPLVASNVQGIKDYVIDGKTGFTCKPNDVDGFAKHIAYLAQNPALRSEMESACLAAIKPFEKEHALRAMQDIYKGVLCKG